MQREAQAMGKLGDHPNIVTIHDVGDDAGQPYIVSQYMSGGAVDGSDCRCRAERTLEIAKGVCRGLAHAHKHGVVHRDLKPGNVWLAADGTAEIGDFGLAVALRAVAADDARHARRHGRLHAAGAGARQRDRRRGPTSTRSAACCTR